MNKLLRAGTIALLCGATITSCLPGRKSAPGGVDGSSTSERPKLPDNEYPTILEAKRPAGFGLDVFPFSTSYVTIPVNGENKEFVSVSLPNNLSDSVAWNLASTYKGMVANLITQWAGRNTGIVVDLRTNGTKADKADFLVDAGKSSFPVILVWDAAAIDRLPVYVDMLKSVPGLQVPDSALIKGADLNILPSEHLTYERALLDEHPAILDCFR
jgi:hypothetical protein